LGYNNRNAGESLHYMFNLLNLEIMRNYIDSFHSARSQEVEDLSTPEPVVLGVYNPETNSYDPPQDPEPSEPIHIGGQFIAGAFRNTPLIDDHHNHFRQ
jgi:hypothetical protein